MSELIAALNTLSQYENMLRLLQVSIKAAIPCEEAVKDHERTMREARKQLDAVNDELIVRKNGVEKFKQHAQEERERELHITDASRREHDALLTHERQKLSAAKFAVEQARRELDEVRQEKRKADEELARLQRSLDQAAGQFSALAGQIAK